MKIPKFIIAWWNDKNNEFVLFADQEYDISQVEGVKLRQNEFIILNRIIDIAI